ncbi:MAG: pseudouridine synthase, partial [Phycisphaeraceae bacterium]
MDQVFTIDADAAGARLDRFLAGALGLSRAAVRALLPGVTVDAHPAAAGQTLVAGQVVAVPGDALAALTLPVADADVGLRVIGQGPGWITVDKPAGVAVHPLQPGERGTLLNAVVTRWPGVVGVGEGGLRSGVVHRLDVTTSGAVVFALEQGAWQRWRAAFAELR